MDITVSKIIADYIKLVKEKYPDFENAYVFGSFAKDNTTLDSDIDIALIFKNLEDNHRFDIQVQLMILASQIDTRIEPHPISHNDFYSENPFVAEIKKTGIELLKEAT